MRLHFGAVPESPDFLPDKTWKPLKEPSPWMAQLIAFPIGIVTTLVIVLLWIGITPLTTEKNLLIDNAFSGFFFSFVGIIIVHELIHAAVHPMMGRSNRSILGLWLSRGVFYAHYDGELSRNRFISILIMPFVIISTVPLFVATIVQVASGWIAFLSAFNALLACVDLLGAGMVLFQVPSTATVRNQGWRTYWKTVETGSA